MRFLILSLLVFGCSLIPSFLLVFWSTGKKPGGLQSSTSPNRLTGNAEKAFVCPTISHESLGSGSECKKGSRKDAEKSWIWETTGNPRMNRGSRTKYEPWEPDGNPKNSTDFTLNFCNEGGAGPERLKRWSQDEARRCFADRHILIVGNSVTKQQYMVHPSHSTNSAWKPRFMLISRWHMRDAESRTRMCAVSSLWSPFS